MKRKKKRENASKGLKKVEFSYSFSRQLHFKKPNQHTQVEKKSLLCFNIKKSEGEKIPRWNTSMQPFLDAYMPFNSFE